MDDRQIERFRKLAEQQLQLNSHEVIALCVEAIGRGAMLEKEMEARRLEVDQLQVRLKNERESLRDTFAGLAITGLAAKVFGPLQDETINALTLNAYDLADAMLARRKKDAP